MAFVRTFFQLNRDIILFAYGLVFFVLGLSVALQSRRYSRLDLARSLSWLAAFGIVHGLYEWGDLFIPIQATYLSPTAVELLHNFHLLLLGASFACLLQFGVTLLQPLGRGRWLDVVAAGLLAAWFFLAFFLLPGTIADPATWRDSANALARYFIGFPGGLLAAYGLRQQALRRIAPLSVPHVVNVLRIAGIGLAAYAIFGGLISPPVPFFPGNWLNSAAFEQAFGFPPSVIRSLIGLTLVIAIIRALEVFEVETDRLIEAMEQSQILAAERERIARDLHDGAIQSVYTAGLLIEAARNQAGDDTPIAGRMDKALSLLDNAIGDLRRSLGELHPASPVEPLPVALRQLAEDPRYRSLVDVSLKLDLPKMDSMPAARTRHILAILQEALSNAVRHARARRVEIGAHLSDGRLNLTVRDDGVGIPGEPRAGYGLRNMRDRARLLGGQLDITGDPGKGTTVRLDVPWRE